MQGSVLTKHQEPTSVWLIDNPDKLEFTIRVFRGNPIAIWDCLDEMCCKQSIEGKQVELDYIITKSLFRNVINITTKHLKHNDIEVIIPPMEMSA